MERAFVIKKYDVIFTYPQREYNTVYDKMDKFIDVFQ